MFFWPLFFMFQWIRKYYAVCGHTDVQKVYLDFYTAWRWYHELPELIRDYNTGEIIFLQVVKGTGWGVRFDSLRWRFSSRPWENDSMKMIVLISAQCAVSQNINLWDELELASELAKYSRVMEQKHWGRIQQIPSRGGKKQSKAGAHIRKLSWSDGKCCFLIVELTFNTAANWTAWRGGTCLQQAEGKLLLIRAMFVSSGT